MKNVSFILQKKHNRLFGQPNKLSWGENKIRVSQGAHQMGHVKNGMDHLMHPALLPETQMECVLANLTSVSLLLTAFLNFLFQWLLLKRWV